MASNVGDSSTENGVTDVELVSQEYFEQLRDVLEKDCSVYKKTLECYQLAQFYEYRDKNFPKAVKMYGELCATKKHPSSCLSRGMIELAGRHRTPPVADTQAALSSFLTACDLGEAKGCQNAGLLFYKKGHEVERDLPRAFELFKKACESKEANGCFYASIMHLKEKPSAGFTPDKSEALRYAATACGLKHPWGCRNAARMCDIGDGVPVDKSRADSFKEAAKDLQRNQNATK